MPLVGSGHFSDIGVNRQATDWANGFARASERAPRRDDTAATFGALRIPGQEFDSLRMRRRANPPDAIDVPDTFVDEAIARGARPTVLPSAMPARARPPGPTPSMPFERMLQPEPATTGLVAGKSFPSVDPDCRGICNEMINSRPQWSRGFSTVKAPSAPSVDASSRPRPTGSVFSTESQTRNILQPVLPQPQLATRVARDAAASRCS